MTGARCKDRLFVAMTARLIILLATTSWSGTWCLRLTKLTVPAYRIRGEMALLECGHELEGDRLYSVKWYKDNEEFYRYVPRATPPQHSYKVDGVRVDHHLSDSMQVFLRGVTLRSSGVYRCEVSAEAPSFSSASGEGRMEVVFPPKEPPRITGGKNSYERHDDLVDLNCTAGRSHPPAGLRWYVNDRPADPDWLISREPIPHGPHGLASAVLGLRFHVRPGQFLEPGPGGGGGEESSSTSERGRKSEYNRSPSGRVIRLRCVATITAITWEGDAESRAGAREGLEGGVGEESGPPDASPALSPVIDRRESLFLVRAASSALAPSVALLLIASWISALAYPRLLNSPTPSLSLSSRPRRRNPSS